MHLKIRRYICNKRIEKYMQKIRVLGESWNLESIVIDKKNSKY